jgi:hypothetical protein
MKKTRAFWGSKQKKISKPSRLWNQSNEGGDSRMEGQMGRIGKTVLMICMGGLAMACMPDATPEEMNQMCQNLVELRGEVELVTVSDAVSSVKEDFAEKEANLKTRQQKAIEGITVRKTEALTQAADDEDKKKLEEEFAGQVVASNEKYEAEIKGLEPRLAEEEKEATTQANASRAKWDGLVDECVATSQKEGVKQKTAQCRIAAKSSDEYWNSCR